MTAVLPWERADDKVGDRHLQRLAAVYVRQPTRQQLLNHQESTRLQYALKDRAVALGWEADRVLVIDDDQAMSATTAVARTGFQRLVTEIGLDHVGLVLGIEMSRLARSGKDWYQLIELCALSGAVLADLDGKGGKRITAATIRDLMRRRLDCPAGRVHRHRPAPPGEEPGPDEWWLKHLAAELDMTTSTLYAWIHRVWITVRRKSCWPHRLIAHADQQELAELGERRTRLPGWYSRRLWTDDDSTPTEPDS